MTVFETCSDAYLSLNCGHLTEESRSNALKYIFISAPCSFNFIKDKLYRTENEKHTAIKIALRKSNLAVDLLLNYNELLNEEEKQFAFSRIFENCESAYRLIESHFNITYDQRKQALDMIILSLFYTEKFILNCDPTQEERIFIIERFIKYKEILICFFKRFKFLGLDRDLAFNAIIFYPDEIFQLASDGLLFPFELEAVYLHHSKYYFQKFKRNFSKNYIFYKTFYKCFTIEEKEMFIHKLKSKRYNHYIEIALKEIKFCKKHKDFLIGHLVMNKLVPPLLISSLVSRNVLSTLATAFLF